METETWRDEINPPKLYMDAELQSFARTKVWQYKITLQEKRKPLKRI